ncbi:YdcF family protein [bacterium]|nr:YdcF family protein [bacterium]NBX97718.1 YdcF family protein [bacterium]NDC94209.1 YdcF family protein [bacterium]NDD84398.1 YdcF family protein [bacterium]NDG29714.1 YdcF family protein [bacterium]
MQIKNPLYGEVMPNQPAIVPGIGLYTDTGERHARGMARVDAVSSSLIKGISIPELYLTGGKTTENLPSEADQIEAELYARVGFGILAGTRIVKETKSTNSLENFINIADELAGKRPEALSLVTDVAHMPRILTIARKIVHKSTLLVPVLSCHRPGLYESAREVPALPVTALTLFGVDAGNTDKLNARMQKYNAAKQRVNAALRRR